MNIIKESGSRIKMVMLSSIQFARGLWKISHLPQPRITIFGGSNLKQTDFYAEQAHALSHRLVNARISIITGGGMGIMEAATTLCDNVDNASNEKLRSHTLGINVRELFKPSIDTKCFKDYIVVDYFFVRKWLMINFSSAFIVFPGGIGTMNELSEIMMLMQIRKIAMRPIILVDTHYWKPFLDWLIDRALHHELVARVDVDQIISTDDIEQAFFLVHNALEKEAKRH